MAAFVDLVNKGRIARGSYLIVESLDRLSREHIRPALTLLLNLIESGIRVVQLLPAEIIYDDGIEPMQLMMGIMELSRGHSESKMKSERVGKAWAQKRALAAEKGTALTSKVPVWLSVDDENKIVVDQSKAATVRRIFDLASNGYGMTSIVKMLNQESCPVIGHARHWAKSSIAKILGNRAVVGEYQPHTGCAGNRKPIGEPIPNYFPVIITDEKWHAARAAMSSRRQTGGRPTKQSVNVFQGLLRDARDRDGDGTIHVVDKSSATKGYSVSLVSYRACSGVTDAKYVGFPLAVFETAVFSKLQEIDPAEIVGDMSDAAERVQALTGELDELVGRIERIKAKLIGKGGDVGSLVDVLQDLDEQKEELKSRLDEARQDAGTPLSRSWGEAQSLLGVIAKAKDANDARVRLRAAMRRIMSGIWCLFVARGAVRLAAVQIHFANGGHRDYLIVHRNGWASANGKRQAATRVWSFADEMEGLDLRTAGDVKRLLNVLDTIDVNKLIDKAAE